MATTTSSEAARLTEAGRVYQTRRAALIASLVVAYWRQRVNIQNPSSVEAFIRLMVPRIEAERNRLAESSRLLNDRIRSVELPGVNDGFKYPKMPPLPREAIETSLRVTGPVAVQKKIDQAMKMSDTAEFRRAMETVGKPLRVEIPPEVERQAMREAEKTIAGAALRHTLSGGRAVTVEGAKQDPKAFGWVRVTKPLPCYFCAMLASRGLELGGLYDKDSFDHSDARFVGDGTAKVHDNCGCGMKPVYTRQDSILESNQRFVDMWHDLSGGPKDALTNFRTNYDKATAEQRSLAS